MNDQHKFLIIDGYSQQSRSKLASAGVTPAGELHERMLLAYLPQAKYEILYPSDDDVKTPSVNELKSYFGIIWTGCNKTLTNADDPAIKKQLDLAYNILKTNVPCWGTCWGIQVMTVAAGGEVRRNPKGREMGLAKTILLNSKGRHHPMYNSKPSIFNAFASHTDVVTKIPDNAVILASNDNTKVQAMEFCYGDTSFWGVQYHPDYNMHEISRLMVLRKEVLISEGIFGNSQDFDDRIERMEQLAKEPGRMDLRQQLQVDDDVLSEKIRQCEFANWLKHVCIGK